MDEKVIIFEDDNIRILAQRKNYRSLTYDYHVDARKVDSLGNKAWVVCRCGYEPDSFMGSVLKNLADKAFKEVGK